MTVIMMKIKENDVCNNLTVIAYYTAKNHATEGVKNGIEGVINEGGTWSYRLRDSINFKHPEY